MYVLCIIYSQSSSKIVTIALSGLPTVTLLGSEEGLILSVKFSLPSNMLSSLIETLRKATVTSAVKVILYVPEV